MASVVMKAVQASPWYLLRQVLLPIRLPLCGSIARQPCMSFWRVLSMQRLQYTCRWCLAPSVYCTVCQTCHCCFQAVPNGLQCVPLQSAWTACSPSNQQLTLGLILPAGLWLCDRTCIRNAFMLHWHSVFS